MKASASVQLPKGDEVEQVDLGARVGDSGPDAVLGKKISRPGGDSGSQAPKGTGEPDPGVLDRVGKRLLDPDEGAHERNK